MIELQRPLCLFEIFILSFFVSYLHKIAAFSTTQEIFPDPVQFDLAAEESGNVGNTRTKRDFSEQRNRDGELLRFPVEPDLRRQPSYIVEAHEVLRRGLQEYLGFHLTNLGAFLKYLINNRTEPFVDEYGQTIRNYKKVLRFIWEQHNETLVQNYAIRQLNKDKLDLCSVARYLSHQPKVEQRETIMKRMGDALRYKCHPCTPYTPKQYDDTIVLSMDDINPEGISPKESLILCNGTLKQGPNILNSTYTSPLFENGEIIKSNNSTNSPFNFKPCNYTDGDLECNQVPLVEVQRVLRQPLTSTLKSFTLIIKPLLFEETTIPDYISGSILALKLKIQYPPGDFFRNSSFFLQVDPDAFKSTKNYTEKFEVDSMDCILLDLNFLSGFDQLNELFFRNIWNIEYCLPGLPSLPSLKFLTAKYCAGFNELYSFPPLINGLTQVDFVGVENPDRRLNDKTVDRIMNWLLISSANTLDYLAIIYMDEMTKVPSQIPSFKALTKLYLYYNNISIIDSGALTFSEPVLKLSMFGNGIKEINPGAFQGNFKDAEVVLWDNNLTRLEESMFGPILVQMASGKGFVDATGNPIDCKEESICHLTWLQSFDRAKYNITCTNDTKIPFVFEPSGINHCSEFSSD